MQWIKWSLVALGILMFGQLGVRWIRASHPSITTSEIRKTDTRTQEKTKKVRIEKMTKPTGEVTEVTETTETASGTTISDSVVSSSLSAEIIDSRAILGVSVGYRLAGSGASWLWGPEWRPFEPLSLGLQTTQKFDSIWLRGTLWLK